MVVPDAATQATPLPFTNSYSMGKKRGQAGGGGWQLLPTEVMVMTFDMLGSSRLAAAQVCRRWRSVAADPCFTIEADGERLTLSEAVAEAKPGYTVRVTAPFCQETIFIDKPLRIEGRVCAPGCADGCATVFQLRPPVVLAQARVLFVNMIFSTAASRSDVSIVCYGPECSSLSFQHCKFTGLTGLVLPISKPPNTRLVLHDCLITGMKNGLAGVLACTGLLEMRDCTVEGNSVGIEVGEAAAADIRCCKIAFNSAAVHLDGAILMSSCAIWGNGRIGCKATETRMLDAMTRSQRAAARAVGQPPVAMTPAGAGGVLLGAPTPAAGPGAGDEAVPSNAQASGLALAAGAGAAAAGAGAGAAAGGAAAGAAGVGHAGFPEPVEVPQLAQGSPRRAPQSVAMWRTVSPAVSDWQARAAANTATAAAIATPAAPGPALPPAAGAAAGRGARGGSRRAAGANQLAAAASAAELMPPPPVRRAPGSGVTLHALFSEGLKGAASLKLAFFEVHDTLVVPPEVGYKSAAEKANRKKVRQLAENVYGHPEDALLDWEIIAQSDLDSTDDEDDADVDSEGMDDAISDSDLDDPFGSSDDGLSDDDPLDSSDDPLDSSDDDDSSSEDGDSEPPDHPIIDLAQAAEASSDGLGSSEEDDSDDSLGASDDGEDGPPGYGLLGPWVNGLAAAGMHAALESSSTDTGSSNDDSSDDSGSEDESGGNGAAGANGVGPRRIFGSDSDSSGSSDSGSDSDSDGDE